MPIWLLSISQQEYETSSLTVQLGLLMTVIVGMLILTIKTLFPLWIKYVKIKFENKIQEIDETQNTTESKTPTKSKTLKDNGIYDLEKSFEMFQKYTDVKRELYIEVGELRAKSILRDEEVKKLKADVESTNKKIEGLQEELSLSRLKIITLEKEIDNLKIKDDILIQENKKLQHELLTKDNIIEAKEQEIVLLKNRIIILEEEKVVLEKMLESYKNDVE